eukprot:TRINITY_DN24106_c0_g1_i1.p1 TRINITY_DN24106_c0_g1~~TRINITY_DN24106_c0_g1_i1.p1  ORF type:complete len:509 (+),score=102.01 TRINITY_DN24106_c0_g1_i1:47-1528(+)
MPPKRRSGSRSLKAAFDRVADPKTKRSKRQSPSKAKKSKQENDGDLEDSITALSQDDERTDEQILASCKQQLYKRLEHWPEETAFEPARKRLYDMLHTTITAGDSNSVLMVGPRGCGKTTVVRSVLNDLAKDDAVQQRGFHCIQLSGLVQTDDSQAIRHIANALIRQGSITNAGESADTASDDVTASAAELARALREALLAGDASSTRSVVIILDEFDIYAHHGQQTLLYTLLDLAQSGTTPLAVVGLTCRLDAVTMLEKRVLSRFSQQQLHLFNEWTCEEYRAVLKRMIALPEAEQALPTEFVSTWNKHVTDMLANPSVQQQVKTLYDINRANLRPLQQLAWTVIAQSSAAEPYVRSDCLFDVIVAQNGDAKVNLLLSASALELCLIIACHQLLRQGAVSFNFEQIYDCYRKFAVGLQRDAFDLYQKPVALKAYEHLCDLELLRPADARAYPVTDVYRPMQLMITTPQLMEVLDKCDTLSTRVKSWAKSGGL